MQDHWNPDTLEARNISITVLLLYGVVLCLAVAVDHSILTTSMYWNYMRIDFGLLTNPTSSSVIIPPLAHLFLFFFSPSLQSSLSFSLSLFFFTFSLLFKLLVPALYTLRSELSLSINSPPLLLVRG